MMKDLLLPDEPAEQDPSPSSAYPAPKVELPSSNEQAELPDEFKDYKVSIESIVESAEEISSLIQENIKY